MGYITQLTDGNQENIFPITLTDAVKDASGNTLTSKLEVINEDVTTYDVSYHNGGQMYSLSGATAATPDEYKHAGIKLRFISNSTSGYTEYACVSSAWTSNEAYWTTGADIYDISAEHGGTEYADLSAALGTNGVNVPVGERRGGMTVKYVQSSDNNSSQYVQYFLSKDEWSANEADWQKMNLEEEVSRLDQEVNKKTYDSNLIVINKTFSQETGYPTTAISLNTVYKAGDVIVLSISTTGNLGQGWWLQGKRGSSAPVNLYEAYGPREQVEIIANSDYDELLFKVNTNTSAYGTITLAIEIKNWRKRVDSSISGLNSSVEGLDSSMENLNEDVGDVNFTQSYAQGSYPTTPTSIGFSVKNGQKLLITASTTGSLDYGWFIYGKKADQAQVQLVKRYSPVTNFEVEINDDYVDLLLKMNAGNNSGTATFSISLLNWRKDTELKFLEVNASLETSRKLAIEKQGFILADASGLTRYTFIRVYNNLKKIQLNQGGSFFVYGGVQYFISWGENVSFEGLSDGMYILVFVPNFAHPSLTSTMELRVPATVGANPGVVVAGVTIISEQVTRILFTNFEMYIDANPPTPAPEPDITSIAYHNADKDSVALGAKNAVGAYGKDSTNQFPTFLVVTDIHGNGSIRNFSALERAFDYAKDKSFVDSVLCLGDIGDDSHYLVNYDWSEKVLGCGKPVLTIPGNHEFVYHTGQDPVVYTGFTDAQIFAKLCTADLLANNGETHGGTNHDKNYWYKDISKQGYDGVTRKIRIIGLYQYEYSEPDVDGNDVSRYKASGLYKQEQIEWFINLLNTVEDNMYVLILTHSTVIGETPTIIDNAFSPKLYDWPVSPYQMSETNRDFIAQIVNAWVTGVNGTFTDSFTYGDAITVTTNFALAHTDKFICFLCGHSHADFIAKHREFDLYQVMLNCTALDQIQQQSDNPREYTGKFMDSVTLFTYDWFKHQVRLIRLGSDVTTDMRDRKFASLNVGQQNP